MSLLDSVIGIVSPSRGLARVQARAEMQALKRRYEGAADGRRHSNWIAKTNPSVNELIAKDLK